MSATRRRDRAAKDELTPGQHLRAEIERLGLDQVAVRKATGVSRQTINNIVNDRQPISRAMAGKLGRLTGRSSDYWLRASFSIAPRAEQLAKSGAAARPFGGGCSGELPDHARGEKRHHRHGSLRRSQRAARLGRSHARRCSDHRRGQDDQYRRRQSFTLKGNRAVNVSTKRTHRTSARLYRPRRRRRQPGNNRNFHFRRAPDRAGLQRPFAILYFQFRPGQYRRYRAECRSSASRSCR